MTNTTWTSGQRTRISSKGHVAPKFPNTCRSVIYHSILQLNRNKLPVDTKFVSLKWSSMVEELTDFPNPPMVGVLKSCNCGWVVGCLYPLSAKPSLQWMRWRKPAFVAVRWWWCAPYVPMCRKVQTLQQSMVHLKIRTLKIHVPSCLNEAFPRDLKCPQFGSTSTIYPISSFLPPPWGKRHGSNGAHGWKCFLFRDLAFEIRRTVKLFFALRLLDKSREENMGNSALAADAMDETQAHRCVLDFFQALNCGALRRTTLQRALQHRHFGKDLFWAKEMSMLKQSVSSRPQTFLFVDFKKHVTHTVYVLVKSLQTHRSWISLLTPVESNFC